jgi:hypothetical protein
VLDVAADQDRIHAAGSILASSTAASAPSMPPGTT